MLPEILDSIEGELPDIQDRVEFTERLLTDSRNSEGSPRAGDHG